MNDPRIEQVRRIVESVVTKKNYKFTKVLIMNNDIVVIIFNDTLIYEVSLKDIISDGSQIAFIYEDIFGFDDESEYINNEILIEDIMNTYNKYKHFTNYNPLVAMDTALRDNEQFEKLLTLKSDEGIKYYKMLGLDNITTYLIPMFSGFISLSKQDNIGINLYDLCDGYMIMEANIFKKKINRNINMKCRIMKI